MSKEYFTEHINEETLVRITDKMLRFEKRQNDTGIRRSLLKLIPAVAAIALVIGLMNFTGIIDIGDLSGVHSATTTHETDEGTEMAEKILTEIPRIVEKSVFEDLLKSIPEDASGARAATRMAAYYRLKEFDNGSFYVFDPNANERETAEIFGYWNDYIGWGDSDYTAMLTDHKMLDTAQEMVREIRRAKAQENGNARYNEALQNNLKIHREPYEAYKPDEPEYAHVKFGANRDTLLLDIEWHTVESYAESLASGFNGVLEEFEDIRNRYLETNEFIPQFMEWYKNNYMKIANGIEITVNDEYLKSVLENLNAIQGKRAWFSKNINGIEVSTFSQWGRNYISSNTPNKKISAESVFKQNNYDCYGNFIYHVYPMILSVSWGDENNEWHHEFWYAINKEEFDYITEDEVIPLLDNLLARGLIAQTYYDDVISDPLAKAIEAYFGIADKR